MVSAAVSIAITTPVERVWEVVADLAGYSGWSACFSYVCGALRADGRLDLGLTGPFAQPSMASARAIVLEVRRRRSFRWLLVPPHKAVPGAAELAGGVIYEVELEAAPAGGLVVTQHLTGPDTAHTWLPDDNELRRWLDASNAALRDRVERLPAHASLHPQTAGSIRVISRHGRRLQLACRRNGLLAYVTEIVAELQRSMAA